MAQTLFNTGNYYSNVLEAASGVITSYLNVTTWIDGTAMTDAHCDGYVYKKLSVAEGGNYVRLTVDTTKAVPLNYPSAITMKAMALNRLLLCRLSYFNVIHTLGYYTEGDGGGAQYRCVYNTSGTLVEDGFLVIKATNLADTYFTLVPADGPVNVKVAGAKGDGVNDDRAAIQNVIDYVIANKFEAVYFPKTSSTYLIKTKHPTYTTAGLVVSTPNDHENVNLIGDGLSKISAGIAMNALVYFPDKDTPYFKAHGIFFSGANPAGTKYANYCLYTNETVISGTLPHISNSYFEDCMFSYALNDGIFVNTWVTTFIHCRAENNVHYGFHLSTNTTTASFINCYALSTETTTVYDAGFYVEKSSNSSFISCASDRTGTGYKFDEVRAVGLYSCGCEGPKRCVGIANSFPTVPDAGLTIDNFYLYNNGAVLANYIFEIDTTIGVTIKGFYRTDPTNGPSISIVGLSPGAQMVCLDGCISYDDVTGGGTFLDVTRIGMAGTSANVPTTDLHSGLMYFNTSTGRPQWWHVSTGTWKEAFANATTGTKGVVNQAASSANTAAAARQLITRHRCREF